MKTDKKLAQVFHFDLYGKRQEKYNFLLENDLQSINWTELTPDEPDYFFVPKDFSLKEEYENGFAITELFLVNSSGVKTHNDDELVSFEPFAENSQKYDYRPFDTRFINYDLKKVVRHRYSVMQHFLKGENIGLITCRQQSSFDFQHIFITNYISDINSISLQSREISFCFPLYLYQETFGQTEKVANLNAKNLLSFQNLTGLTPTPEQIFDYIYAILHSPSYREKYREFLKIDFPRILYPENAGQFNKLAAFGKKLRKLHLLENIVVPNNFANYPIQGNDEIENSFTEKSNDYRDGKVWINDTQYFDNVPAVAWNFYIGGYQPAQKWLKDRKGRKLEEKEHYQKIIYVLSETAKIMDEIDK